jgi:hypothetical protein
MQVRGCGLTRNLGGAGTDGRLGGTHGREKRAFSTGAPSTGSTPMRSARSASRNGAWARV